MKKIILPLLSLLVLAASCQKEESLTRFVARINNSGAKTQFEESDGAYRIKWVLNDQIAINDQSAWTTFTATTLYDGGLEAEFTTTNTGFNGNASRYTAIYPASLVQSGTLVLPSRQHYSTSNVCEYPMAATSGNDHLEFKNLCGILKIKLKGTAIVREIRITNLSNNPSPLCGPFTINDDAAVVTSGSNTVVLDCGTGVQLTESGTDFFVYVPAGNYERFNIVAIDNTYGCFTKTAAQTTTVVRSQYTSISCTTDFLQPGTLVDGSTFNSKIPSEATRVIFEYGSSVSSGTPLNTSGTTPIYGNLDGTDWVVSTPALYINANANCESMFSENSDLASIDFGDGFRTNNVTNMSLMFDECSGLTSLDVSSFNTANVTDMSFMFYQCSRFTSLDVSNFNTANVTDMSKMFERCDNLTSLDLSNFNTANVTDMELMFEGCNGLTSLDLSNFNTERVANMKSMFFDCEHLTTLNVSSFNTANVTSMYRMFCNCYNMTNLNLGRNFSVAPDRNSMCHNLALDVAAGGCTITCTSSAQTELLSSDAQLNNPVKITWNILN